METKPLEAGDAVEVAGFYHTEFPGSDKSAGDAPTTYRRWIPAKVIRILDHGIEVQYPDGQLDAVPFGNFRRVNSSG